MGLHEKVCHTKLDKGMAIVCFFINLMIFPGLGTMIAGAIKGGEYLAPGIIIGLLQFFTAWLIIGWLWSIYTSYCQLKHAKD